MTFEEPSGDSATEYLHGPAVARLLAVWVLAAMILYLAIRPMMSVALHWDEVDYVAAARMGFVVNATDATSFSAADFLEFIRAKMQRRTPDIRPDYDENRDVFLLRHSHPPLLQYVLALLGSQRLAPGHEFEQRLVQYAGGLILIATMLWGYARMSTGASLPGAILVAASGVMCAFYLSRELNCHLWIAITLVPVCIAVARFMRDPAPAAGLIAGATLGLAFLGLQTGLFVAFWAVVALGISTLLPNPGPDAQEGPGVVRRLGIWIKNVGWMIAGFFAVLMVTYPGAVLRLSLLRIFALYAYLIGRGSEYQSVTDVKLRILPLVLPMLVLGVIGIAGVALRRNRGGRHLLLVTAVIGLGYGLIMQKLLLNITYIIPSLVLLSLLGSAVISSTGSKATQWAAAVSMAAYAAWSIITFADSEPKSASVAQVESLGDMVGNRRAWVEGGHVLRYYRPDLADRVASTVVDDRAAAITARDLKKLSYLPITDEQLAGSIVMLGVFNSMPPYAWEKQVPAGTRTLDSPVGKGRIYLLPDEIPPRQDSSRTPGESEIEDRKNQP